MSLRWTIALALGVLVATATLAVGVVGYRATSDRLIAEVDRSLVQAVRLIPTNRRGEIVALPVRGPLAVYDAQVLDRTGAVRATTFDAVVEPGASATRVIGRQGVAVVETVRVGDAEMRVRTLGLPDGALQVARPLEETSRVLESLRRRTYAVVVLVTAAAVVVGFMVSGRVTASLRRLTAAAETVGATGRLDVDVPSGGSDEAGRLGTAFERMLGALHRSRVEQQRLVEDAGHELRTPLTSIRTNLDVLRRHPDLDVDQRAQIIEDLRAETDELVTLVDEIVTVATGVAEDEPVEEVELRTLAHDVAERFERRTGRVVRVEADASRVAGHPTALQRALSNLLDNARKFDTTGGQLLIRVHEGRVEVLDRGPGIPGGETERIFERFHRTDEARTRPGSGLGLAIVSDVVGRHGGTVSAGSRKGGGAVVGFTLPTVDSAAGAQRSPAGGPWPSPPPHGGSTFSPDS